MKKIKLGVNIDHVATIRNARGESHPDPFKAALLAQSSGANSITIHLREDRRHIKDSDLKRIKQNLRIPLNLEIASTKEMLNIAIRNKPTSVCIVPEKRQEITTEGGLKLNHNKNFLAYVIKKLKSKKIKVSLFIEPTLPNIINAKKFQVDCVELHTGKICKLIKEKKKYANLLNRIKKIVKKANRLGLKVNAGHGIDFKSSEVLSKIQNINEFNIGHFIIGESIFVGLKKVIKKFNKILKK